MEKNIMSFNDYELQTLIRLSKIMESYVVVIINHNSCKTKAEGFKYYKDAIKFYKEKVNEIMNI